MQIQEGPTNTTHGASSNEDRFRMLYEISAINSSNPDVQLDAILLVATRIFGLDIGIISKIEGDDYTILNVFHPDNTWKKGQKFTLGNTYSEITLRSKDVVGISQMNDSPYATHPCYQAFGLEAYIGTPLYVNGQRFGTLNFSSVKPLANPFSEEDIHMMRIMSAWVSNIMQNKENLVALRESEAKYKMLVENGLALLCIHDIEGNILEVNKSGLQELGYSYHEMVGKNLKEFMVPTHAIGFDQYLERIKQNKTDSGILPILTKGGELRYWSYKNTLENGQIIGFSQDVTDKVHTEKALAERNRSLKEAQAMAKLGSWSLNIISGEASWSEESFHIYGLDPEQGVPSYENLRLMFHPDDLEHVEKTIENSILKKEPFSIEHRILLKDGSIKFLLGKGRPVIDKKGNLVQLMCMVQDITDRVLIQNELIEAKEIAEESVRIKQEFLANMSHEIRTPMNAVMGFARLLLQAGLDEENNQYAQTIYDSADTLLVIINDILDFSKIEAGKMSLVPIHFDLKKSLSVLQKFFSVKVDEGYVKLLFETDEKIPPALIGDPVRITQILSNLVNNAIKFTENGFVEIKTSIHSQQNDKYFIRFSVKDTGIGISKEKVKTIFNSFEQAEGDITRRFGGTGLGLTIVKKLVELMDGQIQVDSLEGVGSLFCVTLMFKQGDVNQIKIEDLQGFSNLPLELLHEKRILIAEDNRNNQVLATKFLSEVGCHVEIAENGMEAIHKVTKNPFDVVLMDIQMPELDGLQATRIIRSLDPPLNSIPIIAMTAHALKEEENKYKEVGMTDYIPKPFKPDILYSKLLQALGHFQENSNATTIDSTPQSSTYQPDQIDFCYLKEYAGDGHEFYISMLQIFAEDVPGYLRAIEEFLQHKNWAELKKTVHTLKSSIGLIGMENTLAIINEIETNNLDEMDLGEISTKCNFILENCELALSLAKQELDGNSSSSR